MNKLYLIRGVSGAGKSTLAKRLLDAGVVEAFYEADMFFVTETGEYNFNPKLLATAHKWCQLNTEQAMQSEIDICVSNTFTTEKELQPYFELANTYSYDVICLVVENRCESDSIHNVPYAIREKQAERLLNSMVLW